MKHIGNLCIKIFIIHYSFTDQGRHVKSEHQKIQYSCDKCDKSFNNQGSLQRHVKSEHKKIHYSCDKCDKSFTDQGSLQRHVES